MNLTENDLHRIVKEAVQETLEAMGADVKAPLEMQEDFAFLRGLRIGSGLAKRRVFMLVLGGAVTGIGLLIWQGIIAYLPGK